MANLDATMTLRLRDLTGLGARSARQNIRSILKEARQLTMVTGRLSGRLRRVAGVGPMGGDGMATQGVAGVGMAASPARSSRSMGLALRQVGMAAELTGHRLTHMGMVGRRAIGGMFGVAMDFEQQMANVGSVILGVTDKGMSKLTSRAKELGATTRFTATQVGEAMFFMGQAGLTTDQILQGVGDTLNLAAAGNLELGKASDIATDVMAEFGLQAKDIGRISDVLVTGAMSATTNVAQLGQAMSKIGPLAKAWGVSLEEATAITASFANIGLKGGIGGRAFRRIMLSLVKPSDKALESMKALGIEIADSGGNLKRPLVIFQEMAESLKAMPQADQIKHLATIFGAFGVGGAAEAAHQFSKSLNQVNDDGESVVEMLKIFNRNMGSQGRAAEIAAKRMDTSRGRMLELKSVVEDLAISLASMEISNDFLLGLKAMALDIKDFINADPDRAASLLKGFLVVVAGGTVLGPLLTGLGTMARVVGFLASSGGVAAVTSALKGMSVAGLAGVAGLAAAFAALGVTIGTLIDDWLHLSDLISGVNQSEQKRGGVAKATQLTDEEKVQLVGAHKELEAAESERAKEKDSFFGKFVLSDTGLNLFSDTDERMDAARKKIESIHAKGISRGDTRVGGKVQIEVVQAANPGRVGNQSGISVRLKGVESDNPDVPIVATTGLAPAGG